MCKLVSIQSNIGESIEVAEIKKRHIENIIESAEKCKQILGIILFGSSVEERCTAGSDIDFAIISTKTVNELSRLASYRKFLDSIYSEDEEQEYDRLYFKSFEEIERNKEDIPICSELTNKGKVIYRRMADGKTHTISNS